MSREMLIENLATLVIMERDGIPTGRTIDLRKALGFFLRNSGFSQTDISEIIGDWLKWAPHASCL